MGNGEWGMGNGEVGSLKGTGRRGQGFSPSGWFGRFLHPEGVREGDLREAAGGAEAAITPSG